MGEEQLSEFLITLGNHLILVKGVVIFPKPSVPKNYIKETFIFILRMVHNLSTGCLA